jgi:putative spermidine/putrescine transport system ATP-binding protein
VGAALRVAVRPEGLAFASAAGEANRLAGTVDEVEFLGAMVLVHVKTGPARVTVQALNAPGSPLPRAGDKVAVQVAPEAVLVLPEESSTTP